MGILDQLSSQVGDRTEESNRQVAAQCLADPTLLAEIAEGLERDDAARVADCAEVLTMVAEERPEWVAPYAAALAGLLRHKATKARWEATHALALVATLAPEAIEAHFSRLVQMIQSDRSVIVRDSAVTAIGNYAGTSASAAEAAYPVLVEALSLWDGKQAARALRGLKQVASLLPQLGPEIPALAEQHLEDRRGTVRKEAKSLMRICDAQV